MVPPEAEQTATYNQTMAPANDRTHALPCWIDVDLDAVEDNVQALQRWVGPRTHVAAVIKAQAYGVGAEQVARAALQAGARWLAVARVHEGEELRQAGISAPILVLTRTDESEADTAVRCGLSVTVDTEDLAKALAAAAGRQGRQAYVHLKVDTGLHRFGVEPERALPMARALAAIDELEIQALYTHFANADEPDRTYTEQQLACFQRVTSELEDAGYRFPMRHAANSAATIAFPEAHMGLVRTGLSLYGCSPTGSVPTGLALKPAVSLRARVARITCLAAGDGVGYGQIWHADRPSRVALVTAGYADGIPRQLSANSHALICGKPAPLVGRVSMDQTTFDVTDIPEAEVGSVATFFGTDGRTTIELSRFAEQADTIPHAVLTGVGGRVARLFHRDGVAESAARLSATRDVAVHEARGQRE